MEKSYKEKREKDRMEIGDGLGEWKEAEGKRNTIRAYTKSTSLPSK